MSRLHHVHNEYLAELGAKLYEYADKGLLSQMKEMLSQHSMKEVVQFVNIRNKLVSFKLFVNCVRPVNLVVVRIKIL